MEYTRRILATENFCENITVPKGVIFRGLGEDPHMISIIAASLVERPIASWRALPWFFISIVSRAFWNALETMSQLLAVSPW